MPICHCEYFIRIVSHHHRLLRKETSALKKNSIVRSVQFATPSVYLPISLSASFSAVTIRKHDLLGGSSRQLRWQWRDNECLSSDYRATFMDLITADNFAVYYVNLSLVACHGDYTTRRHNRSRQPSRVLWQIICRISVRGWTVSSWGDSTGDKDGRSCDRWQCEGWWGCCPSLQDNAIINYTYTHAARGSSDLQNLLELK